MMALDEAGIDQLYVGPPGTAEGSAAGWWAREGAPPGGLELYTFQVNKRARRFYERHGFVVAMLGDGSGNEEGQPDVLLPLAAVTAGVEPARRRLARRHADRGLLAPATGPPLVLVHGATADHTTWRSRRPAAGRAFRAPCDRPARPRGVRRRRPAYAIEREFEDLAAVADALAAESGAPSTSSATRTAGDARLGAALLTPTSAGSSSTRARRARRRRSAADQADGYRPAGSSAGSPRCRGRRPRRGARDVHAGDRPDAGADLAAYRADPVWPVRAAAVRTTLRELEGEASPAASLEALAGVAQPVLQLLGGDSAAPFARRPRRSTRGFRMAGSR